MALSSQTILDAAFITSGTDCRWLSPGDYARLWSAPFPQIPKIKTNTLKHAQIWVKRTKGVAVLLQ